DEIERLHELVEQAPGFFALVTGPQHVFAFANKAYKEMVGRDELIGKPVREALPELAHQGYFEILDLVYASGNPFVGKRMPVQFGSDEAGELAERFVEFIFQPFLNAERSIRGILIEGYDATEQKRTEDELRTSEKRALEAA